jgi:ComF family protein
MPTTLCVRLRAKFENIDVSDDREKAAIAYDYIMQAALQTLFRKLIDFAIPPRTSERVVRETPTASYLRLMKPRWRKEAEGLLPYGHARVMALVWELKYYDSRLASKIGGALLAEHLRGIMGDELVERPLLVAVPLHPKKQRERGYNQSERICAEAAKRLGSDIVYIQRGLTRTRHTPRQTDLPKKERLLNVRGAFKVENPSAVRGRVVIVVDDVLTTGSTLLACSEALRDAGARQVTRLALAYAE